MQRVLLLLLFFPLSAFAASGAWTYTSVVGCATNVYFSKTGTLDQIAAALSNAMNISPSNCNPRHFPDVVNNQTGVVTMRRGDGTTWSFTATPWEPDPGETPDRVTVEQLAVIGVNSADILRAFSWGFGAVFLCWSLGFSIGAVVDVVRRA